MLDIIKEELREGEKLLWTGVTENFETLDATNKSYLIKKAIIICVTVVALCVLYISYVFSNNIDFKPALVAIMIICAVLASFNFYFDARKLRRTIYAITDQRIISAIDKVKYVDYSRINKAQLKTDYDGHVTLLCGDKTVESKPYQWRTLALTDPYIEEETGLCERFVLYAVPDAENVKKILSDFLPL